MSRHYAWRGDALARRTGPRVRPYTEQWAAARQRRAQRRVALSLTEQTRDQLGFIVKPAGGGTRMYDPGVIDRYLWMQAANDEGP